LPCAPTAVGLQGRAHLRGLPTSLGPLRHTCHPCPTFFCIIQVLQEGLQSNRLTASLTTHAPLGPASRTYPLAPPLLTCTVLQRGGQGKHARVVGLQCGCLRPNARHRPQRRPWTRCACTRAYMALSKVCMHIRTQDCCQGAGACMRTQPCMSSCPQKGAQATPLLYSCHHSRVGLPESAHTLCVLWQIGIAIGNSTAYTYTIVSSPCHTYGCMRA